MESILECYFSVVFLDFFLQGWFLEFVLPLYHSIFYSLFF